MPSRSADLDPPPPRAATSRWRAVRTAAALAMVTMLVVLAIKYGPFVAAALGALRQPDPWWLAAAIAVQVVSMGLYARMQRRLLRGAGTDVPLRRAVSLAYAAHSMSITLPGGPLVSTAYNYRRMRAFGADSTVAAWATAASGVLSSLGLVVFSLAIGTVAAADDTRDAVAIAVFAGSVALVGAGMAMLRRRPAWRVALATRLGKFRSRMPAVHRHRLEDAASWVTRLLRVRIPPRHLAVAGIQSVGNWATDAACLAFCCAAVDLPVHPIPLALTYVAGMAASGLPIIPGGLGTVDGVLILGLVADHTSGSSALAVVVLYRLISLGLIGSIGWLLWLLGRVRRGGQAASGTTGPPALPTRQDAQVASQ
jgi:uncharacterized membrane protein YbhN (UPF0104 family)